MARDPISLSGDDEAELRGYRDGLSEGGHPDIGVGCSETVGRCGALHVGSQGADARRGARFGGARRTLVLLGPAFVAAVAYVDPGNVGTNVTSGSGSGTCCCGSWCWRT